MNPFLSATEDDTGKMLSFLGMKTTEALLECIPPELRLKTQLEINSASGEFELTQEIKHLAQKSCPQKPQISFLGAGAYEHFIPSTVPTLAGRSEFATSYTPYQPEASQGNLQAFFEYQSLISKLFDMEISNASLYDGATALAEGVIMLATTNQNRKTCLVAESVHPFYREVLDTYTRNLELDIQVIKSDQGIVDPPYISKLADEQTVCVVMQHPNFFGCLEHMHEISKITHEKGAFLICIADPLSLALLKPPGQYKADVAVAEGQCLGMPPYFGGETLGIFTCNKTFMRKMPGRLVGMTKDGKGRRGFVLTLQTREQHIRREKATSNICTNHALNATKAAIFLSTLGPRGLKEIADTCYANSCYAKSLIENIPGFKLEYPQPVFKEFVVRSEKLPVPDIIRKLSEKGILIGPHLGLFNKEWNDLFLICTTELRSRTEMDEMAKALEEISQ